MFNSQVYKRSPPWAQEWMVAGRSLARGLAREGRSFRQLSAQSQASQWLSGDELLRFQRRHLRETVDTAAGVVR